MLPVAWYQDKLARNATDIEYLLSAEVCAPGGKTRFTSRPVPEYPKRSLTELQPLSRLARNLIRRNGWFISRQVCDVQFQS